MYIRRKVFSVAIDQTTGEEKLFSTTEIVSEEAYLKMFSENENVEGKKKIPLSKVDSHRGLGRSLLIGGPVGAIGAYTGKGAADKADREGKSDEDIVRAASKRGRLVGAGLGAVAGAGAAAAGAGTELLKKANPKLAKSALITAGSLGALNGAVLGGAAGHFGAKKNARERVKSRAYLEKED